MKILVASDSFKGTLSSLEVGQIIKESLEDKHHIEILPISDGGEGLIEALSPTISGEYINTLVCDPLRRRIEGGYYLSEDKETAIIESAVACGLNHLKQSERNPLETTTFGVGELIRHALEAGAKKLVIGVGGSATNDAGVGLLEALGVKFYDVTNQELTNLSGADLIKIKSVDSTELAVLFIDVDVEVVCDVDNVLLGSQGATYTFAPQKGATELICETLERGMSSYVGILEQSLGRSIGKIPGAGAAGGMGMCLHAFLDAELKRGIEVILDLVDFDLLIEDIDLVITGEGKIDHQTSYGKVIDGISKRCRKKEKTIYAICAIDASEGKLPDLYDEVFSIVPLVASKEEALELPRYYLRKLIENQLKIKLLDRLVE